MLQINNELRKIMPRNDDLEFFLNELKIAIFKRKPDEKIMSATDLVYERLKNIGAYKGALSSHEVPVTAWLDKAIKTAKSGPVGGLAEALEVLTPKLSWQTRSDRHSNDPNWLKSHANAVIVGDTGLEYRTDIRIGVSLLAPNTVYPNHQHPPEEVYIALSDGCWRQNNGEWQSPGPGGLIYNRPNIIHAMKSGNDPLFAIWMLPL